MGRRRIVTLVACLGVAAAVGGCGTPYALRHRVGPGETLAAVAARYGVSEEEIRRFNHLRPKDRVRPGDVLFVPAGGRPSAEARRKRPAKPSRPEPPGRVAPVPKPRSQSTGPGWPVDGKIVRGFAPERGSRGVDLAVPRGTPVRAVRAGEVAYAGTPAPAYGGLVVLRHPGGVYTVYGNLDSVGVKRGETVERGRVLGTSGPARRGLGPHVHFEVRRGEEPVDPRAFVSGG
ncbi:MAG: peptidoglycan DD-metalloendopeptidase family protein [Deltaproteobacteria bacterium]|nr:peptidoglycan DD-metalloendopeptidase family protein [Deltaproteobacteria bacterium]